MSVMEHDSGRSLLEEMLEVVLDDLGSVQAGWMQVCAVPRWFSADVLRGLLDPPPDPGEAEAFLEALALLPVVELVGSRRYAYRADARSILLEMLDQADPGAAERIHRVAYRYFQRKLDWSGPLNETAWLTLRPEQALALREMLYDQLQFDPSGGFAQFRPLFLGAHQFALPGEAATLLRLFDDPEAGRLPAAYRQELAFFAGVQAAAEGRSGPAESAFRGLLEQRDLPPELALRVHSELGRLYHTAGRIEPAISAYLRALEVGDQLTVGLGPLERGALENNLGNLYLEKGDWSRAEKFFRSALFLFTGKDAFDEQSQALNNLGNLYARREEWDAAMEAYRQSLEIKRRTGDRYGEAVTRTNIASIHLRVSADAPEPEHEQDERGKAIHQYTEGLAAFRQLGASSHAARVLYRLALLRYQSAQVEQARADLGEALRIFRTLRMPELERARPLAGLLGMDVPA